MRKVNGVTVLKNSAITQNFTQFCVSRGYPSDYDILEHGLLGSSGSMSKRSKDFQMDKMQERINLNRIAHAEFEAEILAGSIIDTSGKITASGLANRDRRHRAEDINNRIQVINSKIRFIDGLGAMSHKPNGQYKKGYQIQINDYLIELHQLQIELENL